MEVKLHSFLASALERGEWWASRSRRFIPGQGSRYEARWAFENASAFRRRKTPCPYWDSNFGQSSQKTSHYTDSSEKKHVAGMYTKCEQALSGLKKERTSLKSTLSDINLTADNVIIIR